MANERKTSWGSHRRAIWEIAIFGLCSGVLITALMLAENRLLGVTHSSEIYALLVAVLFSGVGIRLGLTFIGRRATNGQDVAMPAVDPFRPDEERLSELKITPRELEILRLIAEGLSTREIADKLFVSESTVKTHSSRLFDKLGAKRRTQAVQLAKIARLIPQPGSPERLIFVGQNRARAVRRLDDILSELEISKVDFVKLDVEGAELSVLYGAMKLLQRESRAMLVEVQDVRTRQWGYAAREILQFLIRMDYQWFAIAAKGALLPIPCDEENYDANLVALPRERTEEFLNLLG